MKTLGSLPSSGGKLWCYNCHIWIKERHAQCHFSKQAHKEGRVGSKKTRKGVRKGRKAKLLQEGVFTKKFLDKHAIPRAVQDGYESRTSNENVINVDENVNMSNNDAVAVIDGIQIETLDSPGLSQSFRESHDVAELEPNFQPIWDNIGNDRTIRYRNLSSLGDSPIETPPTLATRVETKDFGEEKPVHTQQIEPNDQPIWDHIGGDRTVRYRDLSSLSDSPIETLPNLATSMETKDFGEDKSVHTQQINVDPDTQFSLDKSISVQTSVSDQAAPGVQYKVSDVSAAQYMVSDPSKFQNWNNLIQIDQDHSDSNVGQDLSADSTDQSPTQSYNLRSKSTKVPVVSGDVPDSFHRKLDNFLKEARKEADSAFKSQF